MKNKVILCHPFSERETAHLKGETDLIAAEEQGGLASAAKTHPDTLGLISFLSDRIDERLMDSLPRLKVIANYAVGYNNIDFRCAAERGITVCNTPDVLTEATADLTLALLLAASRRIIEADRFMRRELFKGWGAALMLGKELSGSVLGVVGLGRIGAAVARRALAFGMKVVYVSPSPKTELEKSLGVQRVDLDELLERSDVVSLHLPYSPAVHHLFDREAFRRMKPGAVFINVSRGQLMDEAALLEAVNSGHLFAAGLDVYEREPRMTPGLTSCERIVLAPHIGSATETTRERMAEMVVGDVLRVLSGQQPKYPIPEQLL